MGKRTNICRILGIALQIGSLILLVWLHIAKKRELVFIPCLMAIMAYYGLGCKNWRKK